MENFVRSTSPDLLARGNQVLTLQKCPFPILRERQSPYAASHPKRENHS